MIYATYTKYGIKHVKRFVFSRFYNKSKVLWCLFPILCFSNKKNEVFDVFIFLNVCLYCCVFCTMNCYL